MPAAEGCTCAGMVHLSCLSDTPSMWHSHRVLHLIRVPAAHLSSPVLAWCICPAAAASSFWSVWALLCQLKAAGRSYGWSPQCSSSWGRGSTGRQLQNSPPLSSHQHQQWLQDSAPSIPQMMLKQLQGSQSASQKGRGSHSQNLRSPTVPLAVTARSRARNSGAQHKHVPAARRAGAGAAQAAAAAWLGRPCSGVLCWDCSL
jgi:hypothetical protein